VPNGNIIAFGTEIEKGNTVIYLSHEGDDFHGSNLGCVGIED
jgi:hypothetical protein